MSGKPSAEPGRGSAGGLSGKDARLSRTFRLCPNWKPRVGSVDLIVSVLINAFFVTLNLVDVSVLHFALNAPSPQLLFFYAEWQTNPPVLLWLTLLAAPPILYSLVLEAKLVFLDTFRQKAHWMRHLLDLVSFSMLLASIYYFFFEINPTYDLRLVYFSTTGELLKTEYQSLAMGFGMIMLHQHYTSLFLNGTLLILPFLKNVFTPEETISTISADKKEKLKQK